MLTSRRILLALCATMLSLAVLASVADAAEPITVTVRVEGLGGDTLLPQTQVTTTTAPIAISGGSCSGTSAGGALYDAVQGNWDAKETEYGAEIDGLQGLDFPSFSEGGDAYWAFWLNGEYAKNGACSQEISNGEHLVFAAQCEAVGPNCTSATEPEHFLTISAPSVTDVEVNQPVSVMLNSISTSLGEGEASLPAGTEVSAGAVTAVPNEHKVATLSFPSVGTYTLQAHAPGSVPSDTYTICVHNGNDGNCGTQAPGVVTQTTPSVVQTATPYKGSFALVPTVAGLTSGHHYTSRTAPRVLAGTISSHSAVTSVNLELRREYRGRCYAYDGTRERFVKARCGHAASFKVSSDGSFSYLLPSALAPGRYVLDILASDAAGNTTTLARGTSRIVFYVR
jgi:hypothetical protein